MKKLLLCLFSFLFISTAISGCAFLLAGCDSVEQQVDKNIDNSQNDENFETDLPADENNGGNNNEEDDIGANSVDFTIRMKVYYSGGIADWSTLGRISLQAGYFDIWWKEGNGGGNHGGNKTWGNTPSTAEAYGYDQQGGAGGDEYALYISYLSYSYNMGVQRFAEVWPHYATGFTCWSINTDSSFEANRTSTGEVADDGDPVYIYGNKKTSTSKPTNSVGGTMTGNWYIKYRQNMTIEYDKNGGSGGPTSTGFYAGKSVALSSSKPTRSGYTFAGWKFNETVYYSSSTINWSELEYNTNSKLSTRTVVAQWTPNSYSLTVNLNGGTGHKNIFNGVNNVGSSSSLQNANTIQYYVKNAEIYIYSNSTNTNDHYGHTPYWAYLTSGVNYTLSFKAISLNSSVLNSSIEAGMFLDGEYNTYYFKDGGPTINSTTKPIEYLYSFMPNVSGSYQLRLDTNLNNAKFKIFDLVIYATNTTLTSYTVTNSNETLITIPTPTREGYTFNGWTISNSNGTLTKGSGEDYFFKYGAGNNTITAQWKNNTFSDTYFYRNASGNQATKGQTRTYGQSFVTYTSSEISPYTSNGWNLKGWAYNNTSTFDWTYEDGVTVSSTIYTQSFSTLSWYAISERSISIKYDGNGGTYSGGNTTSTQRWNQYNNKIQSVSLKVTSTTPTRKGHTFLGWSTNKSASQADYASGSTYNFNNGYSDSASVTLYAVWEINSYKVRIYAMTGISDIKQPATTWYSDNIGRYKEVSVQYGTSYTLEVAVKLAFNFDRWTYVNDNNGEIVSSNTIYNFTIEARDYTFFAFAKAKNPAYQDANGNWYVEMGEYPQSYADLVWTEYSGDGNYAGLDVSYNKNDNILTLNGSCTATTVEQTTLLSLHGLKFNEGDVYTIKREHISGSVEIQNGSGTSFVIDVIKSNGSETSTRNYNDSSVDFAGKIETKTLTINSSASAEADGFKFWIWGNTGTTIVFNNYKLKISINYDNLLNNAEKETSSSIQIANQELPVYTIKSQVGDMPTGSEFVQYENKWYKVEPVKYVLAGDYSSGFATESGNVTAVSEKVVFASIWNEEKLGLGDGFYYEGKQASINYNFQTYFFNESGLFNIREDGILQYIDNKFYYERFKDLNFGDTLVVQNGTTSTVASTREMDEVFGSGNYSAKFSDLVADILGGYLYYWTRDVGSNLNNAQTISAGGTTGTQMKMQEILGVRITVNVKTFSCL